MASWMPVHSMLRILQDKKTLEHCSQPRVTGCPGTLGNVWRACSWCGWVRAVYCSASHGFNNPKDESTIEKGHLVLRMKTYLRVIRPLSDGWGFGGGGYLGLHLNLQFRPNGPGRDVLNKTPPALWAVLSSIQHTGI